MGGGDAPLGVQKGHLQRGRVRYEAERGEIVEQEPDCQASGYGDERLGRDLPAQTRNTPSGDIRARHAQKGTGEAS